MSDNAKALARIAERRRSTEIARERMGAMPETKRRALIENYRRVNEEARYIVQRGRAASHPA